MNDAERKSLETLLTRPDARVIRGITLRPAAVWGIGLLLCVAGFFVALA